MRHKAQTARLQVPYVYDYFNVSCFTPNPSTHVTDILARFVNCLVKALNDMLRIPRLIIVIPDADILRFVMDKALHKEHIPYMITTALTWIINQMIRAIDAKKDNLKRRKPGSLQSTEPKIIWVPMIDRIGFRSDNLEYRILFNTRLNDILCDRNNHFLMDVSDALLDDSNLDRWGNLNSYGKQQFWTEVDVMVEKFERKKLTLKPQKQHRAISKLETTRE